jgi:hypothetical protein
MRVDEVADMIWQALPTSSAHVVQSQWSASQPPARASLYRRKLNLKDFFKPVYPFCSFKG